MVVIRDVQELKKDARAALDRYLGRPAADLVLLLVDPAGEKVDSALAGASFVVDFEPLSDDRIPAWIAHHAGTSLGTLISEDAARLLHAAVGAELSAPRLRTRQARELRRRWPDRRRSRSRGRRRA